MLSDSIEAPFYITLPSNSTTFSDNKPGSFRVQLPNPINFADDSWEVALTELIYPKSYCNIEAKRTLGLFMTDKTRNDWLSLTFMGVPGYDGAHKFSLPTGYYGSIDELVAVINKRIQFGYLSRFNYFNYTDYVTEYSQRENSNVATVDKHRVTFVYDKAEQRVVMYIPHPHYIVTRVVFAKGLQYMLGFTDKDLFAPELDHSNTSREYPMPYSNIDAF